MFRWAASLSTKVSSALSDTFSPLFRSPLEQLQDAWRRTEAELSALVANESAMDDPQALMESQLVPHLNQLVEALVREEEEQGGNHSSAGEYADRSSPFDSVKGAESKSSTGPCFEYFLNEKILDRLCAMGLPDRPLGMRQLVTKTLDAILQHTRHPILPSMSVHMAVRQFLQVCYQKEDQKRRGYRGAFLSLLHTLASKLKADPSLSGIFFDIFPPRESRPPEFLLFTALSSLTSESPTEGRLAYEACLWITQIPSGSISAFVLGTPFLDGCVESLVKLFRALPEPKECPLIDELLLESSSAAAAAVAHPVATDAKGGVRAVSSWPAIDSFFLRWTYLDQMSRSTYPEVQAALSHTVLTLFLLPVLQPLLLDNREAVVVWTTNFVKHLLLSTESSGLRMTIANFLLGNDVGPEAVPVEDGGAPAAIAAAAADESSSAAASPAAVAVASPSSPFVPSSSASLRSVLLKRMDSLSDQVCLHTLDLMATLLGTREPGVVQNLVIRNLVPAAVDSAASSASSASAVASDILPIEQAVMFAHFTDLPDFASLPNFEDYLLDAQVEGQLWMQAWDDVFARTAEARASELEAADAALLASLSSPSAAAASSSAATAASPASALPAYEGLFLSTLCNKLDQLYENPFATNLKLTAVLSKLAYCPSPVLHAFLFRTPSSADSDATPAAEHDARLLLSTLASVWNKGLKRGTRMQHFARRKEEARQRLNQNVSVGVTHAASSISVETMDGERFFRGLLLLEEVLKELFAIAHSKARLFALQKLARLQATRDSIAAAGEKSGAATPSKRQATPGLEAPTEAAPQDVASGALVLDAVDDPEGLP